MLKTLTREVSNKRFIAYVALLYIMAMTASVWIPASSPIFEIAPFVKLALLPLAQAFLLLGARHRWPNNFGVITAASCAFLAGIIFTTIRNGFF
ncbi:hypothetical protein [Pseudomonas sp. MWU12-2323]|uniref:hypothetical protein n=1 Tax=Pseudomonas sp. MWU12-2323 TaxID=2651296 RepID=UPI00128E1CA0|nr:hypothetical protein [Pseudomonas sp. MWU12-2323]MPQ69389.1 hypothetical protein [Pseudomonas sp. MWU12-2323]